MAEYPSRVTPVLDVNDVLRFAKQPLTDVFTSFAGVNNDLKLSWTSNSPLGDEKTATFILPVTASAALSAVEASGDATISLASSAARTTTQAAGGGTDDFTVTDEGSNVWRFTHNGDWTLSSVVVGDVVDLADFDSTNNGTFRVMAVNDTNDTIDIVSTDGLAEANIAGTVIIYPLNASANTGTLVGAAIDALTNWTSVNADGNDGSGAITTATPDFTIAGANSNEIVVTLGRNQTTVSVATVDGALSIKPGTKYLLQNITSNLYFRLSIDDTGPAESSDMALWANSSIVFWSGLFNTLHANGTTGVLTELRN